MAMAMASGGAGWRSSGRSRAGVDRSIDVPIDTSTDRFVAGADRIESFHHLFYRRLGRLRIRSESDRSSTIGRPPRTARAPPRGRRPAAEKSRRGHDAHRDEVRRGDDHQAGALHVREELIDRAVGHLLREQRVALLGLALERRHDARDEPSLEDVLRVLHLLLLLVILAHDARYASGGGGGRRRRRRARRARTSRKPPLALTTFSRMRSQIRPRRLHQRSGDRRRLRRASFGAPSANSESARAFVETLFAV